MSLQLVIGRANSGKTSYCFNSIKSKLEKDEDGALILIVPEQFNLQAQQELSKFIYPGLLKVDVQSFKNLALRIFNQIGGPKEPIVDDLGRLMILRKVMEESSKDLQLFRKSARQIGFMECLNKLITDFEQYQVTAETLEELKLKSDDTPSLQRKIEDIDTIYSGFMEYIESRFLTNEQIIDVLIDKVSSSPYLKDSHIWLDGFYSFSEQQYELILELLKHARKVTITLPVDSVPGPISTLNENDFFYERKKAYQKIYIKSLENKIKVDDTIILDGDDNLTTNKEIRHLEKEYLKYNPLEYKDVAKCINIDAYRNQYVEMEEVAKKVLYLVREKGYRYRDIAIIAGNLPVYEGIIKDIFSSYNIPSFIDEKKNISTHVLVELIKGVLEVINTNWSYNSVLRVLRTGLYPVEREEIDLLENYILAYGIRGRKIWTQEEDWEYENIENYPEDSREYVKEKQEKINKIRREVASRLDKLQANIRPGRSAKRLTVRDMSLEIYNFLDNIEAEQTIDKWVEEARGSGKLALSKENEQIWDRIMEIFERMVEILGDDIVTTVLYSQILESALNSTQMGMIPPSTDQVIVGDLERSRIHGVKALFVVGTNDGFIPRIDDGPEIFSDLDKIKIEETEMEIIESRNQETVESQFLIYSAITKPTRHLSISCALADEMGKTMRPSIIIYKLKKIFTKRDSKLNEIPLVDITTPNSTLGSLGIELRKSVSGQDKSKSMKSSNWGDVYSWYLKEEDWKYRINTMRDYLFYKNQPESLDRKTAKLIYDNPLHSSVSKLETFRKCAFSYFIKYGIKAKERKLFEFDALELGTLFHKALEKYPQKLEYHDLTWRDIEENEMDLYVGEVVEEAVAKYGASLKYESGQNKYRIGQVKKMTKRAVISLTKHLKQGEFDPEHYEVSFGDGGFPPIVIKLDDTNKMLLTGTIDRVDIYALEGSEFIKILDYKSGKQKFDLLEVYHGLQLQLLLYLDAYIRMADNSKPGGVFYFYIDNPVIDHEKDMSSEAIEKERDKKFKLSGLVLDDKEVADALEEDIKGNVIPANLKQNGEFSARSSVADLEEFDILRNHTVDLIRKLGQEILDGKVSAMPYQLGDSTPCDYCKYSAICQFDPKKSENRYDKLEKLKLEEIWTKLKDKKGDDTSVDK